MGSIRVQNAQRATRLHIAKLQAFAETALELCLREKARGDSNLATLSQVSVVLIGDRRIASLHRQFMDIAGPTDVITFQHGEIFVSVETAQRQAREFHTSTEDEVRLYIVHGLLHLHGFDDTTAAAARTMERVQRRLLLAATERSHRRATPGPV